MVQLPDASWLQTAAHPKAAAKIASNIGFPVVMKIVSPDILHKTDVGGVRLDINSKEEAMATYNQIIKKVKLRTKMLMHATV